MKYEIEDKVFIIEEKNKQFKVVERKISVIIVGCNKDKLVKYKLIDTDKNCYYNEFTERELFKSKNDCELFLGELLQNAKFKIGDIVIFKDDNNKFNGIYNIYNYSIDYINKKFNYTLNLIFDYNTFNSRLTDFEESKLIKLNTSELKKMFKYKKLMEQAKEIDNQLKEKEYELNKFIEEVKNELNKTLKNYPSSRFTKFFNSNNYERFKMLFGEIENELK